MELQGIWLPLITPFKNDQIDYHSYKRLIDYYLSQRINGLIPLATTGELPTINDLEYEELLNFTIEYVAGRVPIYVGAGSNSTQKTVALVKKLEHHQIDGILSVCPYYNRPDQRGIYEHFLKISENTNLKIVIYNIPYRTGRNIENETIHRLAELKNIVGLKDSCGDFKQSMELLLNPPPNFSILTGEDLFFYNALTLGATGGILASAHLETSRFVEIYRLIANNNYQAALELWKPLAKFIPCLFEEPNPAPLKYCLQKEGLIDSLETRLPLTEISNELKAKLDQFSFSFK